MKKSYCFTDPYGGFQLEEAERNSYLYFPLCKEAGLKSAITPMLAGDMKIDQNHFLLQPTSVEDLEEGMVSRNFWCHFEKGKAWSATGYSAENLSHRFDDEGEKITVKAGLLWHRTKHTSTKFGLESEVLSFIPEPGEANVEIMQVTIRNMGKKEISFTPCGAVPIYGRSADNIRDHRNVTSLLHRIHTTSNSVIVCPTLSFDERGHQLNHTSYYVAGCTDEGKDPAGFYPTVEEYVGEGGNYLMPESVYFLSNTRKAGYSVDGHEAMGALLFDRVCLQPGEEKTYQLYMGITDDTEEINQVMELYGSKEKTLKAWRETIDIWKRRQKVTIETGDTDFDQYMYWVNIQPILRRIFGCSFLPYHDYGKGGRGWRDLWQDLLALLMNDPGSVKDLLLSNFGGIRMDGTNATIIGTKPGEFIADRNHMTRVWMDHGYWPVFTTYLYVNQTGDTAFLLKQSPYFKDAQVVRGTRIDETQKDIQIGNGNKFCQLNEEGGEYCGTVIEHLLLQNLTAFYEVGDHNHYRLRGADWNDALDMAEKRGESIAFTAAYAGNLQMLAKMTSMLRDTRHISSIEIASNMEILFTDDSSIYENIDKKNKLLQTYCESCIHTVTGEKKYLDIDQVIKGLLHKAEWVREHIRNTEWLEQGDEGFFNSYYDNDGNQTEQLTHEKVRMMLTGQVFTILSETATDKQVSMITKAADHYLYESQVGGYRLNTDFKEIKTDLGRMFGFAYGTKENGAVFSHMTTMYAYALYERGYIREGYKAIETLYKQSMDFEKSRIYPGIPEYFDGQGRGMYPYLTGAASWMMLTLIIQIFGVYGELGNMRLQPKLLLEQFDEDGKASISLVFGQRNFKVVYCNIARKEYGSYQEGDHYLDGKKMPRQSQGVMISKELLKSLDITSIHEVIVELI